MKGSAALGLADAVARWSRRMFVAVLPVAYWALAAYLILDARRNSDDVFAWIAACPFTAPVGLLPAVVGDVGREWDRAWATFATTAGALVNGLVLFWFINRIAPRPSTAQPGVPTDRRAPQSSRGA